MTKPIIGLLGGSGFVGSVLANHLIENGYALRVLTRAREHARDLWLLPDTDVIALDTHDQEQLNNAFAGTAAIVDLVGILNERGDNGAGFRRVHVDLSARVLKACLHADVPHLVYLSALNADSFAPSYYLRSKGEAEKLLGSENGKRLRVTTLRPSVIFGPHDDFTNRFAKLLRIAPGIFPLAAASARLQPVYVGDVADAIVAILGDHDAAGQRYEIGGPEVLTLGEIVAYIAEVIERPTRIIALGKMLSALQANILEYVPGKPFSRDNLRSLSEDSVCVQGNGLVQLGIVPTPMRVVVPHYLGSHAMRQRYYRYRADAGRD